MPSAEMCSYCNLEKYSMMQSSAFSVYDAAFETRYRYIASGMNPPLPLCSLPRPMLTLPP